MYTYKDGTLLEYLEPLIQLINPNEMDATSFRALFHQTKTELSLKVTNNQFKRIKHYLQMLGFEKSELWTNPLYEALCAGQWTTENTEGTDSADYLATVDTFYSNLAPVPPLNSKAVVLEDLKLFESGTRNIVIAETHGTKAPLAFLSAHIDELAKKQATVLLEGFSLEEIEEINRCNATRSCSLLLYMLVPVERSLNGHVVATQKRQLVSSLISAGIKIIPGDNKHSVDLGANLSRLRVFNYSAIQNISLATPGKPIIFLVGNAHAVETRGYQGITTIIGAQLIDLSSDVPYVSQPLIKIAESSTKINELPAVSPKQSYSEEINCLFKIYLDHPHACKAILIGLAVATLVFAVVASFGAAIGVAVAIAGVSGVLGASSAFLSTKGGYTFFSNNLTSEEKTNAAHSEEQWHESIGQTLY